jgi:hypothetical protein
MSPLDTSWISSTFGSQCFNKELELLHQNRKAYWCLLSHFRGPFALLRILLIILDLDPPLVAIKIDMSSWFINVYSICSITLPIVTHLYPLYLEPAVKWVRPRDRGNVSAYALLAKLDKAVTIILWHGWYGWLISWHSTPQTKIEKGRTWLDV